MRPSALLLAFGLCWLEISPAGAVAPSFPGVTTTSVAATGVPVPIPDNASLAHLLPVDLPGVVVDVDVSVVLSHPTSDQLDVFLISPAGTTITLTTDNGGGNDDVFEGTIFDDQAAPLPMQTSAPNVCNATYANLQPTGPIQPEGALGAFVGEAAAGPWALIVVDDAGGSTGSILAWALTIGTVPSLAPNQTPASFDGPGDEIPDNDADGVESTIVVSGLGHRLTDVDVTVSVQHTQADQLDLFLTAPSGRRIDLVTDRGGGADDLYRGTTFDDDAPTPVSDVDFTMVPAGTALGAVVPEGALGAFTGEDPNGTWTLTVVDDAGGQQGDLEGWTLTLVTPTGCGDGSVDAGEACDDGNAVDGDGCDVGCSISACGNGRLAPDEECDDGNLDDGDDCSSTCRLPETACDDCQDNDGDGLVDEADPGCPTDALDLRKLVTLARKGRHALALTAGLPGPPEATGPLGIFLADANGVIACGPLGDLAPKGGNKLVAKGTLAGGSVTALLTSKRGGSLTLKGRDLDLSALDADAFTLGIRVGSRRLLAGGALRTRGPRRVHP